ncbi:MAG: 2-hydroxyacid dehydrogenase [Chloroflexota bacterium]
MARAFLTRQLPDAAMDIARRAGDITWSSDDRPLPQDELIAGARDAEGLLTLLTETVDAAVLDACPRLRVVANCAVGYNNIDVAACTERGVLVTNTPGVLTETTADFAWALLLATARRVVEADAYLRAGKFKSWGLMLLTGSDVYGKTLGIVGFGRIGQAVARRAAGFGMEILYNGRSDSPEAAQLGAVRVELAELLRRSDYVTLHVPYSAETHHLIGRAEFAQMKPGAYIINTARGAVIDEAALVDALASGHLAGAGLDVYEREPAVTPALLTMPNVVLAPHIASASVATRTRMAVMAATNLVAALSGQRPPNLINPEALSANHRR